MTARETQLVIIRHGESNANVDGLLSGHDTCTGLSDRGAQQAALLRDRLTRTRELRRRIPGGETWAEFSARVGTRLQRVAREHAGERVVVVGHGGTVGASFVALGGLSIHQAITLTRGAINSSITEWHHNEDGWRLIRYNDAAHLA